MDCCCARKPTERDNGAGKIASRRGVPSSSTVSNGGSHYDVEAPGNASKVGLGIMFDTQNRDISGGGLVVASLALGGPAEKSGEIRAGDILLQINDKDIRGISPDDLADDILGDAGSKVTLIFYRPGESHRTVELVRCWTMTKLSEIQWTDPLPPNRVLSPGIGSQ